MKTKEKALKWFNSLSKIKREEVSIDYFGTEYLLDNEILELYLEEVPHYTLKETVSFLKLFAEKFVANTDKAYKQKDIKEWIDENLKL